MTQSPGNNSFTASDIERYHKGNMSAEERHALEKAALDDPFLADALEGYAYTTTATDDIILLQKRLAEKTERRKIAPLFFRNKTWMKAAAVILVIAGGMWLLSKTSSSDKKPLAVEKQMETKTDSTNPIQDQSSTYKMPGQSITISTDSTSVVTAPSGLQKQKAAGRSAFAGTISKEEDKQATTETVLLDNEAMRKNLGRSEDRKLFRNNVESAENNFKTNAGILSDNNRILSNATANNVLNRRAVANENLNKVFGESNSQREQLKMDAMAYKDGDTIRNVNVVMTPQANAQMQEVVVVGYGAQKKKSVAEQERMKGIVIDTLEPAEGWTNFDDYIASHLQMPDEFKEKPKSGEVQLAFDVNDAGEPINITVVKSLCTKCDEEAIRLLKEGPKWKKKKAKKGKVTIKF